MFFREFGCIRVGQKYEFSTKKLWFQIAQIVFVGATCLKVFANDHISGRISDNLIGLLLGHAGSAAMTYGLSKSNDVKAAETRVNVNTTVTTSQETHQKEQIIPEQQP
jgi:hypothetical protein